MLIIGNWKNKSIKKRLNGIIKFLPRLYYIALMFFPMNLFVCVLQYWQPYAMYGYFKCNFYF
jgi:hypothetical protein